MGQLRLGKLTDRFSRGVALTVALGALAAVIPASAQAAAGDIQLVSRAAGTGGAVGNADSSITGASNSGAISGDDRYVVFQSSATNLTADATGGNQQIFLRDLQTGNVTLVSRASGASGAVGNLASHDPMISRSGQYVVFTSSATNLVSGDTNGHDDVFVRDLVNNTTTRVSVATDGTQGNANSESQYGQLDITNDGRYVVFWSGASTLGGNTTLNQSEVYLRDLVAGTTTQISRASGASGALANAESDTVSITPDGHFAAFESSGSNLTSTPDANGTDDSFVRDLQANTTTLVSHNAAGTATGNSDSDTPSISDDGRYVSFSADATDLVSPATSGFHVFVRDRQTDGLVVADRADGAGGAIGNGNPNQGTPISAGGRYVAFQSVATNLTADATGGNQQIFVRDLQSNTTALVSRARGASGAVGNGASANPAISPDGAFIAFDSSATNLTSDTVTHNNVFLRQLLAAPPVNTALPAISGSPQPGQQLTCSQGSWTGPGPQTYAYQWNRDGAAISGATASTYTVVATDAGHQLTCTVTATNSDGSTAATSAAVSVPASNVPPAGAPVITISTPVDGGVYTQKTVVKASYSCVDSATHAPEASCSGSVPSGSPFDTAKTGSHSFTVTSGSTSKTVHYTVKASQPEVVKNGPVFIKARGRTFVVDPGMTLYCPASGPNCPAKLTVTVKRHGRKVVIARMRYRFRAGNGVSQHGLGGELKFRLTRQGAALLRKLGRLRVMVKVVSSVDANDPITTIRTINIKRPGKHKKHRH